MFSKLANANTIKLVKVLQAKNIMLATAESCTGGLLSAAITDIPGSSKVFERGYITYSNAAKIELLTVPTFFIEEYGAVSSQTAMAMAEGALLMSKAKISIAITGIAGPDGATESTQVGTVFFGSAYEGHETTCQRYVFSGGRHSVRMQSVEVALDILINRLAG